MREDSSKNLLLLGIELQRQCSAAEAAEATAVAGAMGKADSDGGNVYHFPGHLTAIPKSEAFARK